MSLALTPATTVETPWLEPRCASMVAVVTKAMAINLVSDGPTLGGMGHRSTSHGGFYSGGLCRQWPVMLNKGRYCMDLRCVGLLMCWQQKVFCLSVLVRVLWRC